MGLPHRTPRNTAMLGSRVPRGAGGGAKRMSCSMTLTQALPAGP